jgi:hypothetical protein
MTDGTTEGITIYLLGCQAETVVSAAGASIAKMPATWYLLHYGKTIALEKLGFTPCLTPQGRLLLISSDDAPELEPAIFRRIEPAFARGSGHGLFWLGAGEVGQVLPPVLAYWREFANRLVTALCARPDIEERNQEIPPPNEADLDALASAAPMMPGSEYLTAAVLQSLWLEMSAAFTAEFAESGTTVQEFFKGLNPAWNVVGRVHFNLAEMAGDSYRLKAGRRSGKRAAVTGPVVDGEVEEPGEEEEAREDCKKAFRPGDFGPGKQGGDGIDSAYVWALLLASGWLHFARPPWRSFTCKSPKRVKVKIGFDPSIQGGCRSRGRDRRRYCRAAPRSRGPRAPSFRGLFRGETEARMSLSRGML